MGQYYKIVNIDKKEYIAPYEFGDGAKLMEFGNSGAGVMAGLAVLLAQSNGRGGGDLMSDHDIVGSWSGDRIVIAGDYGDNYEFFDIDDPDIAAKNLKEDEGMNLYGVASKFYEDISDTVIDAIIDGEGERHPLAKMDRSDDGFRQRGECG